MKIYQLIGVCLNLNNLNSINSNDMSYIHILSATLNENNNARKIVYAALKSGASHIHILGKEIAMEVPKQKVNKVKRTLGKLGVDSIERECWKLEVTVNRSGSGLCPENAIRVSLAPAARNIGYRPLSILITPKAEKQLIEKKLRPEDIANRVDKKLREVLDRASITDVLYSITLLKVPNIDYLEDLVEIATTNALIDAEGIINLQH